MVSKNEAGYQAYRRVSPVVRDCKGAAASVYLLMILNYQNCGQPLSGSLIEYGTGYSRKNVEAALELLEKNGAIELCSGRLWRLRKKPDEENEHRTHVKIIFGNGDR